MSDIREVELWRLRQVVLQIETLIANHGIGSGMSANVLHRMLSETEARIGLIKEQQDHAHREKEEKSVRELAIAYQVQREAALNAEEQAQYESFLKKDFFTREDFAGLEKFYRDSFDKLTDSGKAEMSTRVWEGVRRKEYEFTELPDIVKEKEAARLRDSLSGRKLDSNLLRIPVHDREQFVREWDAGNKEASYQVLNRPSFAENVSLSARSLTAEDRKVIGKDVAAAVLVEESKTATPAKEKAGSSGSTVEVKLEDVLLISDEKAKIEVPLPGGKAGSIVKGG